MLRAHAPFALMHASSYALMHASRYALMHALRYALMHASRYALMHASRCALMHASRCALMHASRYALMHASRYAIMHASRYALMHASRYALMHASRYALMHGSRYALATRSCTVHAHFALQPLAPQADGVRARGNAGWEAGGLLASLATLAPLCARTCRLRQTGASGGLLLLGESLLCCSLPLLLQPLLLPILVPVLVPQPPIGSLRIAWHLATLCHKTTSTVQAAAPQLPP